MIKLIIFSALLNPEFSELQVQNPEFSEFRIEVGRKRGKGQRGRKRGGGGLRQDGQRRERYDGRNVGQVVI